MTTNLLIVHPFVPAYRLGMYSLLVERLASADVQLTVASNPAPPRLAARADTAVAIWGREVPTKWVSIRGRDVAIRRLGALPPNSRPDLVIVEQAVKNLETYPLLARQPLGGPSVAMWGHGRSYSTPQGPAAAALKQFLTRRGQWFFAYTQAGADHVVSQGFPRTRVSVLNNTIDTVALSADLAHVTDSEVEAFQRLHGLTPGRTALFLGGVDRAKGVDFLLESARRAGARLPGFVLLIGGAGEDLPKVREAQAHGAPIRALGRLEGAEKALALRTANVLAIPEWIGLVAVDSLVSGVPIASTWHPSHSPEHAYLVPGETAIFVDHDASAYAQSLVELLTAPERLTAMQARCVKDSAQYSLDRMVDAFVEGILGWNEIRLAGL